MKIKDLHHYKDAYYIYKILCDKSHPNLIISHKYPLKEFITTILDDKYYINNKIINTENINYEYNDIYYYFDVSKIKLDIKDTFINLIKGISNSYNYYKNNNNYIIIDNYEKINPILQLKLKVIIEKTQSTTRYILLTKNYDNINIAIKSRCIMVRIKPLSYYDKDIIFKKYENVKNYKQILKNNDDINLIKKLLNGFIDPYDLIIKRCLTIFNEKKYNIVISKIKEISYNFMNSVLNFPLLQKKIIIYYSQSDISDGKKLQIVKKSCDINYLMINSYKDIIYIEYYLLELYKILND
tara:strand:+ start:168 stop:1058 length:891 start_codon:yes stop_codon:yes gene_type:complete